MMFNKGEERNYGVLMAAIVAIVAIVGMVVYFNGAPSGAVVADSRATVQAMGTQARLICDNQIAEEPSNERYQLQQCCGEQCASYAQSSGNRLDTDMCRSYCSNR